MKSIFVMVAVAAIVSGCGADLTGSKFRDEKDNRYEAELRLGDTQRINDVLREMISNMVQSTTLQWVYVDSWTGVPIDTYAKASQLCSSLGFDLPTKEQIQGEGMTVSGIKNISGNLNLPPERMVYVKGEDSNSSQFPVCVRDITEND